MRLFRGEERVTVQPGRGQWTDGLQSVSRRRQSPYLLLSLMGEVVRRLYICFILNFWVKPPGVCVCAVLEQPDWDDVELKKASSLQWVSWCQGAALCLKLAAAGNLAGGGGGDVPAAMLDWADREGDRFSFEDSDRFEEDSLCSWSSEPESLCNNWRGWKKPSAASTTFFGANRKSADGKSPTESRPLCSLLDVHHHFYFLFVFAGHETWWTTDS